MPKRLAPAYLAALLLACGPESPDSAVSDSTSIASGTGSPATTTTVATTTTATTTATTTDVAVTTSGVDSVTTTSSTADPTMSDTMTDTMTEEGTTAVGPCVADPASGTCSAGCDALLDCCKCDGQEFFPDPMASDCTLAMGIVTAYCPWGIWNLQWPGKQVPEVWEDECAVTETGWYQKEENGDRIIQLCGQACTDYLAGEFTVITGEMFCEAA